VAGRAIDERMRGDLVESALAMVVAMRGELAKTVIVDPDRGCTPAHSWRGSPARHDLTRSVGRIGVCWATLPPNHSGATLIVALYDRYLWPTRTAPKLAVGDWIERIYNWRRRSALGMISPAEYKNGTTQTTKPPNPVSAKQGQAQGTLLLVHPQLVRQIFKRHQHNLIIVPHQRRIAHPGPHRPTLTMLELHNQIRQRIDTRKRGYLGRYGMENLGERRPRQPVLLVTHHLRKRRIRKQDGAVPRHGE
jgi:hypothetical protein